MGPAASRTTFKANIINLSKEKYAIGDEFWDSLWKSNVTVHDIFDLIRPDDVLEILNKHPENLKIIFSQGVIQLFQVVETPYPVYFDQALTCARVLTRLLPVMIEQHSNFIQNLFWKISKSSDLQNSSPLKRDANDGDDNNSQGSNNNKRNKEKETTTIVSSNKEKIDESVDDTSNSHQDTEPLAVILVNTIFHLLFLPDFTIEDPDTNFKEEDLQSEDFKSALVWTLGIGPSKVSTISNTVTQYDKNRTEILRLMLSAFCDALFQLPTDLDPCGSLWLEVATSADVPYAEILFNSLMNTILTFDPLNLEYINMGGYSNSQDFAETAVRVLLVLLDYGYPSSPSTNSKKDGINSVFDLPVSEDEANSPGFNVFRLYLSRITSEKEYKFMFDGFLKLLNSMHKARNTVLPSAVSYFNAIDEVLLLLWKCFEENNGFFEYVLNSQDLHSLVVPLCFILLDARKDESKSTMIYLATYILLKLSGDRHFGISLNIRFNAALPVDIPLIDGCHGDLLIACIHKLIMSGSDSFSNYYSSYLTIISNFSPYCKSLLKSSAMRLVDLFQLFSSPVFLYSYKDNYKYLIYVMETFDNLIQYQYNGNAELVYSIFSRRQLFERFAGINLSAAISSAEMTRTATILEASTNNNKDKDGNEVDNSENDKTITETESENRFEPTVEWLDAMKNEIPLDTTMRLLEVLGQEIMELRIDHTSEFQMINYISNGTLVGLLPLPHPIVIRQYRPTDHSASWFTSILYGMVYSHTNAKIPLIKDLKLKLFHVVPI